MNNWTPIIRVEFVILAIWSYAQIVRIFCTQISQDKLLEGKEMEKKFYYFLTTSVLISVLTFGFGLGNAYAEGTSSTTV